MKLLRALVRWWRYGQCVQCNKRKCRKIGFIGARRRDAAYCADCWGEDL